MLVIEHRRILILETRIIILFLSFFKWNISVFIINYLSVHIIILF